MIGDNHTMEEVYSEKTLCRLSSSVFTSDCEHRDRL